MLPLVCPCASIRLWANETAGGDHYVTQVNTDGTSRDFVDFDSNLIGGWLLLDV